MDPLARVELDDRRHCGLFQLANTACPHDGRCFRQNPQHFLDAAHPITAARPMCENLLRLQPCSHVHRCSSACARPCPQRAALDAHNAAYYHGPTARQLERVANGEPASKRVCVPVTTTATTATITTTTTTTTTITTTAPGPSKAPTRKHVGGKLSTDFGIVPFSTLDANQGYWRGPSPPIPSSASSCGRGGARAVWRVGAEAAAAGRGPG